MAIFRCPLVWPFTRFNLHPLGWRPFSIPQFRLINAEGSAFLPDGADGAAGEIDDLGIGKLAQEGEFVFCPWDGIPFHAKQIITRVLGKPYSKAHLRSW